MKSTTYVLTLCLMLIPWFVFGQAGGRITGKITDGQTGEPLIGVTVRVEGSTQGTVSDVSGEYVIPGLSPGNYTLLFNIIGYNPKSVTAIKIEAGQSVSLPVSLNVSASTRLGEVVVSTTYGQSSLNALYARQKNLGVVSDGLSADLIKKSPDKNTGEVLKRISGTSMVDNKFVVVRGLAERYNATMMDAATMPSTEPDKKAFSFDLVPSDLISGIVIYKTSSPDMPGDAAGGTIQINTRDFPDHKFMDLSIGTGYNSLSTFQDFYRGRGAGKWDFLGFDDGSRSLPEAYKRVAPGYAALSTEGKAAITRQFHNSFGGVKDGQDLPPVNLKFSVGNTRVLANGNKFGYTGALSYGVSGSRRQSERSSYLLSKEKLYAYKDESYSTDYETGALLNFAYSFGENKLTLKNFFVNDFTNTFVNRTGATFDGADNTTRVFSLNTETTQNGLFNSVLGGKHALGKIGLDWHLSYGKSYRKQPDQRILTVYQKDEQGPYLLQLSNENSPAIKDAGRVYSDLQENIYSGGADFSLPFPLWNQHQLFKFGFLETYRSRNFSALALGYASYLDPLGRGATIPMTKGITPANVFAPEQLDRYKIILANIAQNSKDYRGTSNQEAAYLMWDARLHDHWRLVWGARLVNHRQRLVSLNQPVQDYKRTDLLPSANLTWSVSKKTNIRLAYSRTLNYPEFRELAAFRYYDYQNDFVVLGNSQLQRSLNDNLDFRMEYYPRPGEILSASLFYKHFTQPIEETNEGNNILAFANADQAKDYGIEVEVRKRMDFLGASALLHNLMFYANASWIKGSVIFDGQKVNRPLQGQSPYLINSGLSYSSKEGDFSASILYNRIGPRMKFRGENDGLDTYEKSRDVLDFQLSKKVLKKAGEVRISVADILKQPIALYYKYAPGKAAYDSGEDKIISSIQPATVIRISFKYNFFNPR